MLDTHRFFRSFKHAWHGVYFAFFQDQNLRIHFVIALFVIAASIFFRVNPFEMGILGVMILLVITTEMINSAIEQMADLITKEHREEARIAKDVAAGMVLISAFGSVIVGILIFAPHILRLFK